MDMLQWVERLGGWAVVVWIVVWLTKRWEKVMNDMLVSQKKVCDRLDKLAALIEMGINKTKENKSGTISR